MAKVLRFFNHRIGRGGYFPDLHSAKEGSVFSALVEFEIRKDLGGRCIAQREKFAFGPEADRFASPKLPCAIDDPAAVFNQAAYDFYLLFYENRGNIFNGQFPGHIKRMILAENCSRPAYGFIQEAGQDAAMGNVFIAVEMSGQAEPGSYGIAFNEKTGPHPAVVFIAAQKTTGGMGQVFPGCCHGGYSKSLNWLVK
jgi:hypothetical protein